MSAQANLRPTDYTWVGLLRSLVRAPSVSPRGIATREILGTLTRWDMKSPIVSSRARKLGYRYMAAEAAWVLSGDNRVATIAPYSQMISKFSDDGVRFAGAYGPRVVDQLSYVVDCLISDRSSRQAVINIWRDRPRRSRDVPCTLSLQFMIRDGMLHAFSTMRSNDVWLGTPYDIFTFSQVAAAVAIEINRLDDSLLPGDLGFLHHSVASHHLYESNFADAKAIVDAADAGTFLTTDRLVSRDDCVHEFASVDELVSHLWAIADGTVKVSNHAYMRSLFHLIQEARTW